MFVQNHPDFEIVCRVYYEDTDAGGVVYYANYLRFAERARSEWIRSAMGRTGPLWQKGDPLFVVRHLEADYKASARLDDSLRVTVRPIHLGGASLRMAQTIESNGVVLVSLAVTLVAVNVEGKVMRIPEEWRQNLSPYINEGDGDVDD